MLARLRIRSFARSERSLESGDARQPQLLANHQAYKKSAAYCVAMVVLAAPSPGWQAGRQTKERPARQPTPPAKECVRGRNLDNPAEEEFTEKLKSVATATAPAASAA